MNVVLNELKTRASFLHKKLKLSDPASLVLVAKLSRKRQWVMPAQWQHKHCLNLIAAQYGFHDWQHAHHVFSGAAIHGDDVGDFWHQDMGFTNHWFSDYFEASDYLTSHPGSFLLPYRRQYFVAECEYLEALQLQPKHPGWQQYEHNLCLSYGSEFWLSLAIHRLRELN